MSEQYDPKGRYDVFNQRTDDKVFELVKGVLYEGPPNFQQEYGAIQMQEGDQGLTFTLDGAVLYLVPQQKA